MTERSLLKSESEFYLLTNGRCNSVCTEMSSLKVMPASSKVMPASEPKPGKIYATMEQKKTLMAIYEADNYPDSSMLEQVVENEDRVISKIRIQPLITMFYVSKFAQTYRVQLCVGFPRAWLQSRLGKAMVHVHQVGTFFKNIEETLGKKLREQISSGK